VKPAQPPHYAPAKESPPQDARAVADLVFRRRAGQLTATLARVLGLEHLDLVEDVVQDAFVRALRTWPTAGIPDDPGAWILATAKNRAIDVLRRQGRWREKRDELERSILPRQSGEPASRAYFTHEIEDDELRLIFAMCHPALSRDAQVALTLKAVCGLGTAEIARAFLTGKPTIAQRLVRAKRVLHDTGVVLEIPAANDLTMRLEAVLEVLYLTFNEGYSATSGDHLVRAELCAEAIRLAESLAGHPRVGGPPVHALAALFLFQAARLPARTAADGDLLPLDAQDRSRWDRQVIRRALEHHRLSADGRAVTPYHLQAEIASCHTLAPRFEDTDWARILDCYDELVAHDCSPVVALNRGVAVAHVEGPEAGLLALDPLKEEASLQSYHRLFAVEAELLWRAGKPEEARRAVSRALSLASSGAIQTYLEGRQQAYLGKEHQ
jgi:RNA polymerase sigma-70 factor (ECF subfamily)